MSRYSKSYGRGSKHGGAGLKFDTLLKACSNSKKPSANRTAGALGRFGIASFTSTRNSSIESTGGVEEESRFKFLSKRPKFSDSSVNNSPASKSYHVNNSQNNSLLQSTAYSPVVAPITPVYKPRKFFKSRDPVAAEESSSPKDSSYVSSTHRSSRPENSETVAPIKIPIPKSRLHESPEKASKPLRTANNANPPNSQPIKLRIFKDKATSKLVSVSEAPPPILQVERDMHHKSKPEKIPKKRGRKPKNVVVTTPPSPVRVYEEPPVVVVEKKSGRSTRNSRKHDQGDDGEQPPVVQAHYQPHRNSDSSIEAMPILSRHHSLDSEENSIISENYSQALFHNSTNSTSSGVSRSQLAPCTSTTTNNVAIEKKLEDDAEFQQLSQMLSSMEEEGRDNSSSYTSGVSAYPQSHHEQEQQLAHSQPPLPAYLTQQHHHHHPQHLAQQQAEVLPQLSPVQSAPLLQQQSLHQPYQQQQQVVLPQQPTHHLQYNSQSYSDYHPDSMRPGLVSSRSNSSVAVPSLSPPESQPPPKVRDAQDLRAILEDDWDESLDEESPKKSPPKTSRFDLSAFGHDSARSSSSSPTNPSFSPAGVYGNVPYPHSAANSQALGGLPMDFIGSVNSGFQQYPQQPQSSLSHPSQYIETHHHLSQQHITQPFNAPYAVRNLLSTSGEYQSQSLPSNFSQNNSSADPNSRLSGNAYDSSKENMMKDSMEQDKSGVALNLSVTQPSALIPSAGAPPAHPNTQSGGTKKGSIFKSRALTQSSSDVKGEGSQGNPKKRLALYKHKFGQGDGDEEAKAAQEALLAKAPVNTYTDEFEEDSDPEDINSLRRVANSEGGGDKVVCKKNAKKLYSVIRNVKPIHELQESGEFHEFDGDVWYILEELKDKNLMINRCLSAITLAQRCMEPAFRMHLRAHGTVAEFCTELHDAPSNSTLALLASTVLFVLSQDRLNMDLDTDSLKLIIALTKAGETASNPMDDSPELVKLRQRVFDLVIEMKNRGHAKHLKVEKITASELALETLLYLTSKRAGEWVKHELRTLGGLDYIVAEVITSLAWLKEELHSVGFSDAVIERLWKIDRCLRVLQQVTFNHEENQRYLLGVTRGNDTDLGMLDGTPEIFIALFRFCNDKLSMLGRDTEPAKVIREILFSVLRVLVNLSHDYRGIVLGSEILCKMDGFLQLCLHSVFHMPINIPDEKVFDLLMHSLCMLLNLVEYSRNNRNAILSSTVRRTGTSLHSSWSSDDSGVEEDQPTLDALVEMFVAKERAAKQEEASTDDILTKGSDSQKDSNKTNASQNSQASKDSQESESTNSVQDTIDKLIQTAGKHMENSLIAAYVSLLLAYLIMDDPSAAETVRNSMPHHKYLPLMIVLKKLFNFMSITSSASGSLRGLKATAIALKFYAKCDPHSNEELKKIIPD